MKFVFFNAKIFHIYCFKKFFMNFFWVQIDIHLKVVAKKAIVYVCLLPYYLTLMN